jgi:uncharacterized protein YbjT (DUF2867 family)
LITGAGGGAGGVSRLVIEQLRKRGERVRALVHRDDARANPVRELGAEVVAGDLTDPQNVVGAMDGVDCMFFSISISPTTCRPRWSSAMPRWNTATSMCS